MRPLILRGLLGLGVLTAGAACGEGRGPEADRPVSTGQVTKPDSGAAVDLASPPTSQVPLPAELQEISGLAVDAEGDVFAHGDEEGTIYQLDIRSGRVTKRFSLASSGSDPDLGKKKSQGGRLAGDFEGIAVVGDRFFLVSSNGVLLEFAEGPDGDAVPYRAHETGLESVCEVEGLEPDPSSNSLLLLCKTMRDKSKREQVAIYAWSLADQAIGEAPRVAVPWSRLTGVTGGRGFNGSAVAVAPGGRSLLLVAGPQQLFAEVDWDGVMLRGGSLDRATHPQPESLAFLPDGTLLMASEGGKGEAVLASYSPGGTPQQR